MTGPNLSSLTMGGLIDEWASRVLGPQRDREYDPPAVTATGSVLRPPASRAAIEAAERRLGSRLPPSYRQFLEVTNGAYALGESVQVGRFLSSGPAVQQGFGFLPVEDIGLFATNEPFLVDLWLEFDLESDDDTCPVGPHFRARGGEAQYRLLRDKEEGKTGHFLSALQVSVCEQWTVILLNPGVVDCDGEWEVWDVYTTMGSPTRHNSFRAYLESVVGLLRHRSSSGEAERRAAELRLELGGAPREVILAAGVLAKAGDFRGADVLLHWARSPTTERLDAMAWLPFLGKAHHHHVTEAYVGALGNPDLVLPQAIISQCVVHTETTRSLVVDRVVAAGSDSILTRDVSWSADVLAAAWERTGDWGYIEQAWWPSVPQFRDRCIAALREPTTSPVRRAQLIQRAVPLDDPFVRSAIVDAAELPGGDRRGVGLKLWEAGWKAEAEELLASLDTSDFAQIEPGHVADAVYASLAQTRLPAVLHHLLEAWSQQPTVSLAGGLGWFDDPRACEALLDGVRGDDRSVAGASRLALEKQRSVLSRDALVELADEGDLRALGAVARLGDRRALPRLRALVTADNQEAQLAAAFGLAALRAPSTEDDLLSLVLKCDLPDACVTACDALGAMRAPQYALAIAELRASDDPEVAEWAASLRGA